MDKEKICFKCGIKKKLSDFYKHAQMLDGYLNKCKDCTKKDSLKTRNDKIDYYRKYDRERGQTEERKKLNRDRSESQKCSEEYRKKRYESTKKYRKKYPEKNRARCILGYHIRKGNIKKLPCIICGYEDVQAHHEDYDFPLNVIWLCEKHHKELHKNNGSLRKKGEI